MISPRAFFRTAVPEGFEWVVTRDPSSLNRLRARAGGAHGGTWDPIQVEVLSVDDHGSLQRHADLPWLSSEFIVLRDDAVEIVGNVLRSFGELVPLECDHARLSVFVAPLLTGVLDEAQSELVRFSTGRIMALRSPVFNRAHIGDALAFRLAEMPNGSLFLHSDLVDAVRATGLTAGTDFVLAETGPTLRTDTRGLRGDQPGTPEGLTDPDLG